MRRFNIVTANIATGCLIALCVLILSYTHTAALFERAGYRSILSHIGVIGFETAFILGTVTLIWAKLNGETVRRSTKFVFTLGILINLYSNITSGIAKNGHPLVFWIINEQIVIDESVLVGALIPLLIEAAVLVISDAIVQHRALVKQANQTDKQTDEMVIEEISIRRTSPKRKDKQEEQPNEQTTNEQTTLEENNQSNSKQEVSAEVFERNKRSKRSNNRINHLLEESNSETPEEIAKRLKDELGDWPSIRNLAREANITPYRSKRILDELKSNN